MKRLTPSIFLFLLAFTSAGQNWLNGVGGAGNDEALDITPDGQGGYILSGFYSFGVDFNGTLLNSVGEIDAFVARTNAAGDVVWVKQFGGTGSDAAYANDIDANGNIFVSGYFSGTMVVDGTTVVSNSGSQDAFLAKLDPAGDLLWIQTFGGNDHDFVYDLALDQLGNAIITGNFKETVTIGPDTYTSTINPDQNEPSYDIFVVKYDPSGSVIWSKHGQAVRDDRGTGLAINANNEIALIGQFSDTLTFSNMYVNQVYNTGFVMLLDSDGDELWMKKMSASVCIPYDIVFHQDSLMYITGDFTGQLAVFTTPLTTSTSSFQNKIFLLKMNTQGNLLWLENDGSDSPFSSRAVDVDAAGNAYLSGYFKCRLDEYSQQYGDGVFLSAGRRDVFIAKYSQQGTRLWERQFGGSGDDLAWDLTIQAADQPVIAGAFSKLFNAPDGGNFASTGWSNTQNLSGANPVSSNYCSDNDYGRFSTMQSTGHQDVLIAKPVDLSRQPYDFFQRSGSNCIRDFLTPCINGTCPDTILSCEPVDLSFASVTGSQGYIGPEYDLLWSTGSTDVGINNLASGTYWLQVDRADGCYSSSDTVVVIVHDTPATPLVSDDVIVNTNTASPERIFVCYPDSVQLEMSGVDTVNNYYGWSENGFIAHPFLDTTVASSGTYFAHHISPAGCKSSTPVLVYIDDWANEDTLDPHLLISFQGNWLDTDTLIACEGDEITYLLLDSAHYASVGLSMPYNSSEWTISFPDIPSTISYFDWEQNGAGDLDDWMMGSSFTANESSLVIIDVELIDHCNGDTSVYNLHREFYLDVTGFSVQEYGPHRMCPGDTVEIGISGGDHYNWSGGAFIPPDTLSSINALVAATYNWSASVDLPSGGQCTKTDTFIVRNLEAPDITMIPSHGTICPFDSVLMTAPPGTDYQWIGPNNAVIGSVQSIYATTPGFYFVQFINPGGCFLVSNEVEVRGFNSPYMFAEPQQTICEGGTVTLTVVANEGSILDWPGNLLDNVFEQDIYQAGYYEVTATFCGITDTVSVTVIDVSPEVDLNIAGFDTICAGEILNVEGPPGYYSYNWSTGSQDPDIEVTEAGMYFLTAENLNGCIGHSDTLFVEVLAAPDPPVLSDTTVCYAGAAISIALTNDPVYWFSQQLDSLGIQTQIMNNSVTASLAYYGAHYNGECFSVFDTASVSLFDGSILPQITGDQVLCAADSLHLEATASSVLTYSWILPDSTVVNGGQLALANPDSGTYLLLAAHPFCGVDTVSHSLAMVQTDAFAIDFTLGDSLNCAGDQVLVTVPGNFSTIEWQPSESISGSIIILEDELIWASIEDTNGCNLMTDTVDVQFREPPSAIILPTDTICEGTATNLSLSTQNDLLLDDGVELIPANNPFSTVILNSDTAYTFVLTDELGCESDPFTWNIEVTQTPEQLDVLGDTLLCDGDELLLSASPIGSGTIVFFDQFGDTLGLANSIGEFLIDSVWLGLPSGGAFATLDINGCVVESGLLEIEVLPIPESPVLIVSGNGCPGDTVLVHASDTAGLNHFWVGPNGFSSNEPLLTFDPIDPNEQGDYTLYVEQNICASDTSSVTIMLAPVPEVTLIPDSTICAGDFVELFLGQSYDQILWSTGEMTEMITVSDSGSYWVQVTNEFGCEASDTTLIQAVTCQVAVSNVITPNNDGFNDFFKLDAEGLVEVNVKIFNRLGRLIYRWDVVDGKWDGTIQNNGFNAQAGTYYFVGSYMDLSGESGVKKGFIQLMR